MSAGARFHLVEVSGEGLLLDAQSGALLHLNEAAALVWRHHLAGASMDDAAAALVSRFRISDEAARRDARQALRVDGAAASPRAPEQTQFTYERRERDYVFFRLGVPLLRVEADGAALESAPGVVWERKNAVETLAAIAPKLMALRGHFVMHASAVAVGERLIVFSGVSGAGKTTTARAMAQAGAAPVAEDKLVVAVAGTGAVGYLGTEEVIARWAERSAIDLGSRGSISGAALDAVFASVALPIAEFGFIDAGRRGAPGVAALTPLATAGAIFDGSFHGSDDVERWRAHLAISAAIAKSAIGWRVTAPDGLTALRAQAADWLQRGTLAQ